MQFVEIKEIELLPFGEGYKKEVTYGPHRGLSYSPMKDKWVYLENTLKNDKDVNANANGARPNAGKPSKPSPNSPKQTDQPGIFNLRLLIDSNPVYSDLNASHSLLMDVIDRLNQEFSDRL